MQWDCCRTLHSTDCQKRACHYSPVASAQHGQGLRCARMVVDVPPTAYPRAPRSLPLAIPQAGCDATRECPVRHHNFALAKNRRSAGTHQRESPLARELWGSTLDQLKKRRGSQQVGVVHAPSSQSVRQLPYSSHSWHCDERSSPELSHLATSTDSPLHVGPPGRAFCAGGWSAQSV